MLLVFFSVLRIRHREALRHRPDSRRRSNWGHRCQHCHPVRRSRPDRKDLRVRLQLHDHQVQDRLVCRKTRIQSILENGGSVMWRRPRRDLLSSSDRQPQLPQGVSRRPRMPPPNRCQPRSDYHSGDRRFGHGAWQGLCSRSRRWLSQLQGLSHTHRQDRVKPAVRHFHRKQALRLHQDRPGWFQTRLQD